MSRSSNQRRRKRLKKKKAEKFRANQIPRSHNNQLTSPNIHNEFAFQSYAAAFIDLLGHGSRLLELPKHLPQNGNPSNGEMKNILINGVDPPLKLVEKFKSAIEMMLETRDQVSRLFPSIEQQREWHKSISTEVCIQTFGDTVLAYTPLNDPTNKTVKTVGLWQLMQASASVAVEFLLRRTPCRGAVEIGWGVEIVKHQLHGRLLIDVYNLAESEAGYPRILVGPNAMQFLEEAAGDDAGDFDRINREVAKTIREKLIVTDEDGKPMLDFAKYAQNSLGGEEFKKIRSEIDNYIQIQIAEYRRSGDDKLLGRYHRLLTYINRSTTT